MIRIPVSKFRAELKRWLESARAGEEIVVTEHGKPLARVVGAGRLTAFERLVHEGVIVPARKPKMKATGARRVRAKGSVSDIVSEQRGD